MGIHLPSATCHCAFTHVMFPLQSAVSQYTRALFFNIMRFHTSQITMSLGELKKWMLREWEKQVSVDNQVQKWLKTDCLHRRAARRLLQVNPHTVQHERARAVTLYAGESMFVELKTTTVTAEVKAEALWELLWPQLLRIDRCFQKASITTSSRMLTPNVRVQHEMCIRLDVGKTKIHGGVNKTSFLFWKSDVFFPP